MTSSIYRLLGQDAAEYCIVTFDEQSLDDWVWDPPEALMECRVDGSLQNSSQLLRHASARKSPDLIDLLTGYVFRCLAIVNQPVKNCMLHVGLDRTKK